ncbi:MAG: hypothetical protein ACRDCH_02340, partial [Metamycoplasmataceae bacterium]
NPPTSSELTGTNLHTVGTLEKLFNGIDATNLANVTSGGPDNPTPGALISVTLSPKDGYVIRGGNALVANFTVPSLINVNITARTLTSNEIKAEDVDNDAFKSYSTLQKLFEFDTAEVTGELLDKAVVITMTPETGNQQRIVTLTATMDYEINGQPSLDSNQFIIPINYTIEKTTPAPADIPASDVENENYKNWSLVSKLFTGANFNEQMLGNLNIELVTITANQRYQIKLTPKTGFNINGGMTEIISDEFTVV